MRLHPESVLHNSKIDEQQIMLDAHEQFVMRRNKNDRASLLAVYPVCLGFPNGMKLCMDSTYCMNDHVGYAKGLPETEECVDRSI